jgi:uncharacterized membrane protein
LSFFQPRENQRSGKMNQKIGLAWGLAFLVMVGYFLFIQSALPDHLAVHFDINGKPNGFQSKSDFIMMFFCFIFLMNGLFLVLFWGIDRLPVKNINMPWKKYWLATEERKVLAFEKLRGVSGLVGIFLCATFLITEQVIYQANAANPWFTFPINGGMLAVFALSALMIGFSIVIMKPPVEE